MTKLPLPRTRNGSPRLRLTSDVTDYWAERIELRKPANESFQKSSMICRGDSIFHYGQHFELARILRTKSGDARLVLLNGDVYAGASGFGLTTAARQSEVRSAVGRSSVEGLVVPFSALDSAGIDYTSIQPIEVRDDRQTFEDRASAIRPTDKLGMMEDPSGATTTEKRWDHDEHEYRDVEVPAWVSDPNRTGSFMRGHAFSEEATRGEDGIWRWSERRHWLGDCVFRAKLTEARTRRATKEELDEVEAMRLWNVEQARLQGLAHRLPGWRFRGDGLSTGPYDFRRMLRLQMAGEGLRQAQESHYNVQPSAPRVRNGRVPRTVTRWATFISSFDYQEPRALYFLAELPHGARPRTVDDAVESLKPPEVLAAIARGLPVLRHGDVFAIPTKLDKRRLRVMRKHDFAKRLQVLDTNHSVTEGVICRGGATLGRGVMRHDVDSWRTPDHVALKLGDGKTWHLLIRNTVPRSR